MAMSSKRLWILAVVTAALAACNTANTHIGDEDPFLGESVKYDQAIQTINPMPVYPAQAAQPGDNGEKGALAVQHYRKGEVKTPEPITTTSGTSGGGGGGPQ
jgi:type IV pilus biogenesis protein CpaD/CtpE